MKIVVALKQSSDQVSDEEFGSIFMPIEQISDEFLEAYVRLNHSVDEEQVAVIKKLALCFIELIKGFSKEQLGRFLKVCIMLTPNENLVKGFELAQEYRQFNERKTIRVDLFDDKQQQKDTVFIKNRSIDSLLQ